MSRTGKAVVTERRSSARLQKLKSDQEIHRRGEEANAESEEKALKRSRIQAEKRPMVEAEAAPVVSGQTVTKYRPNPDVANMYSRYSVTCIGSSSNSPEQNEKNEQNAYQLVKEAMRTYNKNFLYFAQEDEKRKVEKKQKKKEERLNAKKLPALANRSGTRSRINSKVGTRKAPRPDLKALSMMKDNLEVLNLSNGIGPVPGIDVGHQFFSRAEMVVLGFHNHWLNGIDFIAESPKTKMFQQFRNLTFPLTRCIVLSGQYEDDLDNLESIIYTGQGGNNLRGNKRQFCDQELVKGNLGLKNCMEQGVPVRVVRGHRCKKSYVKKVYTYDGLYKVVNYWAEKGVSGFTVYKFALARLEGQPELTTNQVQFTRSHVPVSVSSLRGVVCNDISNGQEVTSVPATNLVDEPPVPPTGFTYTRNIQVAKNVKIPENAAGCNCIGPCKDNKKCSCAKLNGSDFPYVKNLGGRLVEPKAVVFECGPNCSCGPDCCNRTSQKGLRFRLEVFRTPKKGWGVRSWDFIPSGSPVCEYIGVLKKTEDLDASSDNNYIFDIDCLQTMKGIDGREKRLRDVSLSSEMEESDDLKSDSQPEFCIDAGSVGNVARFINHCCQPNLFVQCVLSSHHDIKLARIVLFAADNIPPLQELTYDYGYALDSLVGPDGEVKKMACYCGAENCRKRLL